MFDTDIMKQQLASGTKEGFNRWLDSRRRHVDVSER